MSVSSDGAVADEGLSSRRRFPHRIANCVSKHGCAVGCKELNPGVINGDANDDDDKDKDDVVSDCKEDDVDDNEDSRKGGDKDGGRPEKGRCDARVWPLWAVSDVEEREYEDVARRDDVEASDDDVEDNDEEEDDEEEKGDDAKEVVGDKKFWRAGSIGNGEEEEEEEEDKLDVPMFSVRGGGGGLRRRMCAT
jgi:hypothetical protein